MGVVDIKGYMIVVMVLACLLFFPGTTSASEESRTVTIEPFDGVGIEIDNRDGLTLTISYDVRVKSGVSVNVYFADEIGWIEYDAGLDFDYYFLYSNENKKDVDESWTWDEVGVFYVIIDNSHEDPSKWENVTVEYEVTWNELSGSDFLIMGGICIAIIVVIVIVIFLFVSRRKKQKAVPQSVYPQMQGPPGTPPYNAPPYHSPSQPQTGPPYQQGPPGQSQHLVPPMYHQPGSVSPSQPITSSIVSPDTNEAPDQSVPKAVEHTGPTLCPQCGQEVPRGNKFCGNCGQVI